MSSIQNSGRSSGAQGTGFSRASQSVFPSPFLDVTDLSIPRDVKSILRMCESVYFFNPMVKAGIDRLVSYPITRFIYDTPDTDLSAKYKEIHEDILDLKSFMVEMGKDVYVYGNSFISPYFPFDRFLKCRSCKMERPLKQVRYKFTRYKFTATCPCGASGEHDRIDRRSLDKSRMKMIRWNPHNMHILHNDISGKSTYWYQLDGEMRSKILAGDPEILCDTPWEFVVAVQKGQKFKFKEGMLFHTKQPTLSGRHRSWGLPPTLPLMKLHYFTAALRRANIAISYDLSVPFRVAYPERGGAVGDPAAQVNIRNWVSNMQKMVAKHRSDPTSVQFSPGPVGYQSIGGEARALMYSQEIRQSNEEIMAALHIPQDLFYGTLTAQAAPVALRLLNNVMSYYLHGLDRMCAWLNKHISEYFDMTFVAFHLQSFVEADDSMRTQNLSMLAQSGKVSDGTLFEAFGLDADAEYKKQLDEQRRRALLDKEFQAETAQTEGGGGSTPGDMLEQANQIARQWLSTPYEARRGEMSTLRAQDSVLFEQAKSEMERLRSISSQVGVEPAEVGVPVAGRSQEAAKPDMGAPAQQGA